MNTTEQYVAFDVVSSAFDGSENRNKQDVMFIYTRLLYYILTGMSYSDEDRQKMIDFFKNKYQADHRTIKDIEDFSDQYKTKAERAIWC